MSRDKRYQKLLNSKRWIETKRIVWARANGLCERCMEEGFVTAGVDCHHIKPIESAMTEQEMERLAYDVNNIRLLCIPCHIKTHKEMASHKKEGVKVNAERRLARWIDKFRPKDEQSSVEDGVT